MARRNTPPERHERQRARIEAERRQAHRSPAERRAESLWLYGIHPVLAALANPRRKILRILATQNALARLTEAGARLPLSPEETSPRNLDNLLGSDAVTRVLPSRSFPSPRSASTRSATPGSSSSSTR